MKKSISLLALMILGSVLRSDSVDPKELYLDQTHNFDLNDYYLSELAKESTAKVPVGLTIYESKSNPTEGYITLCGYMIPAKFIPMKYRAPGLIWFGTNKKNNLNLYVPLSYVEEACGVSSPKEKDLQ